jgi:hypothetical protein
MISANFLTFSLSRGTAGPVIVLSSQCCILITHILLDPLQGGEVSSEIYFFPWLFSKPVNKIHFGPSFVKKLWQVR